MQKYSHKKTICVFTGGGVAPALNAALYGAIFEARKLGWRVLGGKWGWKSMLNGEIIDLDTSRLGSKYNDLKNIGGTFLGTSRTNPAKNENSIKKVKKTMEKYKIDYLLPIGGDDTLGAAKTLWEKYKIPAVCVPKTIDNDLCGTYFTPGFPSAAHNLTLFTQAISHVAKAVGKIYMIECMGGNAGWLAACGAAAGADIIIIPEKETKLSNFLKILKEKYEKNKGYAVIVIAQHSQFDKKIEASHLKIDEYGIVHPLFISLGLKDKIEGFLNCEVKISMPSNFLSGCDPIPFDQKFAVLLGKKAVNLLARNQFGYMACVEKKGDKLKIGATYLSKIFCAKDRPQKLNEEYFDFEKLYPKKKFFEYLKPILNNYFLENNHYTK